MKITLSELKQIIRQEVRKTQRILKEQVGSVDVEELQNFVNEKAKFLGTVTLDKIIESDRYVLFFSADSEHHIKERHKDAKMPGSLFEQRVNLRSVAQKLLNDVQPIEENGRVKWLGANYGSVVGHFGLAATDRNTFNEMISTGELKEYKMPTDPRGFGGEVVYLQAGERTPTKEVSMITGILGDLQDGRQFISLITMYPGGQKIGNIEIPPDRNLFKDANVYFVVSADSPLLKKLAENRRRKTRRF